MIHHILAKAKNMWSLFSSGDNPEPLTLDKPAPDLNDGWSWIPNWPDIFNGQYDEWLRYVESSKHGRKILIATCIGGNSALTPIESLLCVALTLRGASVDVLLCDKAIPACTNALAIEFKDQNDFLTSGPTKCDWCFESGSRTYKDLNLSVHRLSQYIEEQDKEEAQDLAKTMPYEEISHYHENDLFIGEHAVAGALRYFARGDFNGEPHAEAVVRRYLEAGILSSRAIDRLFKKYGYEATLVNHGIYVPQGLVIEAAKKYKSPVALWYPSYRNKCVSIFPVEDNFQSAIQTANNGSWNTMPWTDEMESDIVAYLQSRSKGTYDWIKSQAENGPTELAEISRQIGIDFNKPTIGLLTNVAWDAQVFYPTNALPSMLEWLMKTIKYFESRPNLQLLIRVHPGELTGYVISRQLAVDEINNAFPVLPANVFIIPPESPINTYAVMMPCKAILIYATTAGLEFACMGFPVIVSGEAAIRDKGFSYDASSETEYLALLDRLPFSPEKLSPEKISQARKFAYHTFFRKMIPLEVLEPQSSTYVPYTIKKVGLAGFLPGQDAGLDIICDGILNNADFIYPYKAYKQAGATTKPANHDHSSIYQHVVARK